MDAPSTVIFGLGLEVGSALALRFFETGHHVFVADTSEQRVKKARANLPEDIEVMHVEVERSDDNTITTNINNVFVRTIEETGKLDNLVIVPRIPKADRLLGLSDLDLMKSQFEILASASIAAKEFAVNLLEQEEEAGARADQSRQRGTITFILSSAVSSGLPGQFSAQVVQGAASAMMRATALELAEHDIRVNAVEAVRPRAEQERWLDARTPLARPALADEIADAAIYLSSQRAAIITGETLVLDGGRSLLSGLLRAVPDSDLNTKSED